MMMVEMIGVIEYMPLIAFQVYRETSMEVQAQVQLVFMGIRDLLVVKTQTM